MKIGIVNAKSYDSQEIGLAIDDLFEQIGGLTNIIPHNSKVFIKANLVREMSPDKGATTHPEIVLAVAKKLINECNCTVTVGDSSGGVYTKAFMSNVYRTTKMDYACAQSGAMLNDDFDYRNVVINGKVLPKVDITNSFLNADVVVNIGKLKTHSFTGYTGCVKNLYGLIPGLVKAEVHSNYPNLDQFTDLLIDLEQFASTKIKLHILDAVVGMEGQGPTNGKAKFIGKIIAGTNPYLVDVAGVSLFANPNDMPLIKKAIARKVLTSDFSETDFDFGALKKDYIENFKRIEVFAVNFARMPKWVAKLVKIVVTAKVKPMRNKCRGCAKCYQHCPAKAISMVAHKAHIDQSKCIRCYCCQELCPFDAIKLVKPVTYHIVRGLSHTKKK